MGQVLGNPVLDAVTTCQCSKVDNAIQKNQAVELPRKEAGYEKPMLEKRQRYVVPQAVTAVVEEEDGAGAHGAHIYSETSTERDLEVHVDQRELKSAEAMFTYSTDIRAPLVVVEEGENEDEDLSVHHHAERPMSFYTPVAVSMGPGNQVQNEMSPEMLRNILGHGYDCDSYSAASDDESDDENVRKHENKKTTQSRAIMSLQTCVPADIEEEHAQYYGTKIQQNRRSLFDRKNQQEQDQADADKKTATDDKFLFHDSGIETSRSERNDEDVLTLTKRDSESEELSVSESEDDEDDVYMRKPCKIVQSHFETGSKSLSPLEQILRKPLDPERKLSMASANSLKWE